MMPGPAVRDLREETHRRRELDSAMFTPRRVRRTISFFPKDHIENYIYCRSGVSVRTVISIAMSSSVVL